MYLTGKNKENFEKWFTSDARFFAISCIAPRNNYDDSVLAAFEQLPFEIQIGVYLAYYDFVGLLIERRVTESRMFIWDYRNEEPDEAIIVDCEYLENINEWYKEAFKKADEIINEFLK